MSMRINTNIEAFNAQRNLGATGDMYAKSVEKLSSGLRINRAADDAAGLSISEKLKAQINGLSQAQSNAQDGISLIQTAEGALNETHSILQRMRELTVQAANDTLADSDRTAIKSEMTQLTSEIDRIAKSTQFNGKNLLDGSLTANRSITLNGAATGLGSVADNAADLTAAATFTSTAAQGTFTVTFTNVGRKFSEAGATDGVAAQGASETGTVAVTSTSTGAVSIGGTTITVTIGETAAQFAASVNALATGVTATVNGSGQLVFTTTATGAAVTASATALGVTGSAQVLSDLGISSFTATQNGIDAHTVTTSGGINVGGATINVTRGESLSSVAASINASAAGSNFTATVSNNVLTLTANSLGAAGSANSTFTGSAQVLSDLGLSSGSVTTTAGMDIQASVQVNGGTATAMTYAASGNTLSSGGFTLSLAGLGAVEGTGSISTGNVVGFTDKDSQANLQIGANAQQTLSVGIEDMSSTALGVNSLDVSSGAVINGNDGLGDGKNADGTDGTLNKIDKAIAAVSNQRSTLGAYQNRLEHTISNLGVAQENLSASESRIVDVDMASEMVNFTKLGILQQAGTAILAQANQAPQGVLKLLG